MSLEVPWLLPGSAGFPTVSFRGREMNGIWEREISYLLASGHPKNQSRKNACGEWLVSGTKALGGKDLY